MLRKLEALGTIILMTAALAWPPGAAADPGAMTVYKTPTCGCCRGWVDHMRAHGYEVTVRDLQSSELSRVKSHFRVPASVQSCHTAIVDGYVVEGHVPAQIVSRLLNERPAATGISAPGMPAASPGMDIAGGGPYEVVIFDTRGGIRPYQRVD